MRFTHSHMIWFCRVVLFGCIMRLWKKLWKQLCNSFSWQTPGVIITINIIYSVNNVHVSWLFNNKQVIISKLYCLWSWRHSSTCSWVKKRQCHLCPSASAKVGPGHFLLWWQSVGIIQELNHCWYLSKWVIFRYLKRFCCIILFFQGSTLGKFSSVRRIPEHKYGVF